MEVKGDESLGCCRKRSAMEKEGERKRPLDGKNAQIRTGSVHLKIATLGERKKDTTEGNVEGVLTKR